MELKFENLYIYFLAAVVNLLAFVAGIAFAWTSPVLPKLNGSINPKNNPLNPPANLQEEAWIAALMPLGSCFGPPLVGLIADKIGRKKALLFLALPMLVSLLASAFAQHVWVFFVARFIMGLGAGTVFTLVSMYLIEIAEDNNRGTLGCMVSVFAASGILFAFAVGPFLSVQNFCLVCIVPLVIFVPVFCILNPESPHYLAYINDQNLLKLSLLKLRKNRSNKEVENEIVIITRTAEELRQTTGRFVDLFTDKVLRKGLMLSAGTISLQQFAGIAIVLSYMQTIFDTADTGLSPEISVIIVGVIQAITTVVTSSLADILGRRILLIISSIGSSISLFALGLFFFIQNQQFQVSAISWLPVTSLILFVVFFNIGLGPVPWTVMAELFPSNVKAKATTITGIVCFIENFMITLCFPYWTVMLGNDFTFWILAVICLVGAFAVYWCLPETKGKSIQEIQGLLGSNLQIIIN